MTFLEAAIEVLRWAEEPLHFSSIAKKAVERNLLSHVGRDPEAAMRSCLNSAVRAGSEALVARSKPGYYKIRPGATLPEPLAPEPGTAPEPTPISEEAPKPKPKRSRARAKAKDKDNDKADDKDKAEDKPAPKSRKKAGPRRRERGRARRPPPRPTRRLPAGTTKPPRRPTKRLPRPPTTTRRQRAEVGEEQAQTDPDTPVEFEAPSGSGLEGVTDVAIVNGQPRCRGWPRNGPSCVRNSSRCNKSSRRMRPPNPSFRPSPRAFPGATTPRSVVVDAAVGVAVGHVVSIGRRAPAPVPPRPVAPTSC